jgi:hypothetical protein
MKLDHFAKFRRVHIENAGNAGNGGNKPRKAE